MSYYGPGSIYSIGLHNLAALCLLLSIGSLVSMLALWGRVEGTLGTMEDSLSATFFEVPAQLCVRREHSWGVPLGVPSERHFDTCFMGGALENSSRAVGKGRGVGVRVRGSIERPRVGCEGRPVGTTHQDSGYPERDLTSNRLPPNNYSQLEPGRSHPNLHLQVTFRTLAPYWRVPGWSLLACAISIAHQLKACYAK